MATADWYKKDNPSTETTIEFEFDEDTDITLPEPIAQFAEKPEAIKEFKAEQNDKANFAITMERAEETFKRLEKGGFDPTMAFKDVLAATHLPEPLANAFFVSNQYQQYVAAQLAWANAVVRDETGAAIAAGEFERIQETFFPSLFQAEDATGLKTQIREERLEAMKNAAGPAYAAIKSTITHKENIESLRRMYKNPSTAESIKKEIKERFQNNGIKL